MAGLLVQYQTVAGEDRALNIAEELAKVLKDKVGLAWEVKEFGKTSEHPTFFALILFFKREISKKQARKLKKRCFKIMRQHARSTETVGCEYQRVQGHYQESNGILEQSDSLTSISKEQKNA